jgi:prophage regulatory protein
MSFPAKGISLVLCRVCTLNKEVNHMEVTTQPQPQIRCMRVAEVAKKLGIGVSTVWKLRKDDQEFPQPFNLSPKITLWVEHELDAFIASKRQMMH